MNCFSGPSCPSSNVPGLVAFLCTLVPDFFSLGFSLECRVRNGTVYRDCVLSSHPTTNHLYFSLFKSAESPRFLYFESSLEKRVGHFKWSDFYKKKKKCNCVFLSAYYEVSLPFQGLELGGHTSIECIKPLRHTVASTKHGNYVNSTRLQRMFLHMGPQGPLIDGE